MKKLLITLLITLPIYAADPPADYASALAAVRTAKAAYDASVEAINVAQAVADASAASQVYQAALTVFLNFQATKTCPVVPIQPVCPDPNNPSCPSIILTGVYDKDIPGNIPDDSTLKTLDGYIVGDRKCLNTGVWQVTRLGSCGWTYTDAGLIK